MASTNHEFKRDFKKGREAERLFENYLRVEYTCNTESSYAEGYFPGYDLSTTATTGTILKYEVKWNAAYNKDLDFKNGTIVIELSKTLDGQRVDSGLSLTTADYYGFVLEGSDAFHIISTTDLKRLCFDPKLKQKKLLTDRNGYLLAIFDKPFLLSKMIVI